MDDLIELCLANDNSSLLVLSSTSVFNAVSDHLKNRNYDVFLTDSAQPETADKVMEKQYLCLQVSHGGLIPFQTIKVAVTLPLQDPGSALHHITAQLELKSEEKQGE